MSTAPTVATFNPANANSYNQSTSLTVYDSLGAAHTASMYFVNTGGSKWNAFEYIDGTAVNAGKPVALTYSSSGALTGVVDAAAGTNTAAVSFGSYTPTTGAAALNMTFNLSNTTQYRRYFRRHLGDSERLHDRSDQRHIGKLHRRGAGELHQRPVHGAGTGRGGELRRSAGAAAGRQHQLGADLCLRSAGVRPGGRRRRGKYRIRLARAVERRHHRAAGQHDHGAARLPGQRRDDLH